MIINAQCYYDSVALKFVPIRSLLNFAPGWIDRAHSWPMMYRFSGLLGIVCFTCDLAQRAEWRRRIAWTICISGTALVLFGLAEKILGMNWYVWQNGAVSPTGFASYFYHANAGAFINLIIPFIAGSAMLAIGAREGNKQMVIWIPFLLIAVAGALAAVSKAAIVITFLLLFTVLMLRLPIVIALWRGLATPLIRAIAASALALAVVALGWFGWDRMIHRWTQEAWVSYSAETRLLVYRAAWSMQPDSGLWGFGPGTFRITFPFYTDPLDARIAGFWRFAHQDYLQALIEWGWIGTGVWAVLFGGGIAAGLVTYWRRGSLLARFDQMFLLAVVLALIGVALHAAVDFPLQIPSLQLYAAVYVGIAWGSSSWKQARAS